MKSGFPPPASHFPHKFFSFSLLPPFQVVLLLCLVGLALGCGTKRVHYLTEERFAPNPAPEEVMVLRSVGDRPHLQIARLDSYTDPAKSNSVREAQLQDLRERAARLGADGLVEVRHLEERHRGMVADPAVPFYAWMPGGQSRYFLRATAIRFLDEEAPDPTLADPNPLPDPVEPVEATPEGNFRPGY